MQEEAKWKEKKEIEEAKLREKKEAEKAEKERVKEELRQNPKTRGGVKALRDGDGVEEVKK